MKFLMAGVSLVGVFVVGLMVGQQPFLVKRKPPMVNVEGLHTAAATGDFEGVKHFLDEGTSANARDSLSQTPLLHATWWGHENVVALLLKRGGDVNAQSLLGHTGLYWAVNHGYYAIAKTLLEAGALPNLCGLNNWTPLHEAAAHGDDRLYVLLLRYGAREDIKDRWGYTARRLMEQRKLKL